MNQSDMMAAGDMAAFGMFGILMMVAFVLLGVWLHWRILQRMGYAGAWSLLLLLFLVPFIGMLAGLLYVVAVWVIAFVRWPREAAAQTTGSAATDSRPPDISR